MKHANSFAVKLPIAFPSLLCGIILSQHPGILVSTDVPSKRESPLSLSYRLFEGTHVADIVMTSGKEAGSSSTSKSHLIAELEDTCRALDETIRVSSEKKVRIEMLIKALAEEEDVGVANMNAEHEEEDTDGSQDM